MLGADPPDVLVAYPVIGRAKLERLMQVASKTNVTVALDSLEAARQLSEAAAQSQIDIGVLAELDAGLGRVGVAPSELVGLVQSISRLPRIRFEGIAFYPGHIKLLDEAGQHAIECLAQLLAGILRDLQHAGFEAR